MRVVHVGHFGFATGGAAIAMLRMHRKMLSEGHESFVVCIRKGETDDDRTVEHRIPLGFKALIFLGRSLQKILFGHVYMTGFFSTGIWKTVNALKPDKVYLHWLQSDTIAVDELKKIAAPMCWFHHDLWPARGMTPHAYFKIPGRAKWLDRLVLRRKRKAVLSLKGRITPVCASRWVAGEIHKSPVWAGFVPLIEPIPIDPVFHPDEAKSSASSTGRFVLLFGSAQGFDTGIKGGDRLLDALEMLTGGEREKIELRVFGRGKFGRVEAERCRDMGVVLTELGELRGEELAQAYRDADLLAFPSRCETYGLVKFEALACGTPVIAFDETACAEGIVSVGGSSDAVRSGAGLGWIAAADDIADYATGLRWFVNGGK